ncbi:MAG: MerR family transcriptional regulator, partial [Pelagerythrobacter marensis]
MRIGQLARITSVKSETIRFYEREGILAAPPRTQANYRDYGPAEEARLNFIRRARDLGFSMARIRE